jgi:hypothetical protein
MDAPKEALAKGALTSCSRRYVLWELLISKFVSNVVCKRQRDSAFQKAFEQYIEGLSTKHRAFIEDCKKAGSRVACWQESPALINAYISELEENRSQRVAIMKILDPFFTMITDMNELISSIGEFIAFPVSSDSLNL